MKRQTLLSIAISLSFLTPAPAQDVKDPPPHKMLQTFLLKEAQKHFEARRAVVAKLETPDQIKARQVELKKKFLEALGDLPPKTPLNAKVVRTIKADGYRVENVIFESRPDHHITANLYIPDGKGPFPGVLIPCGHSVNGKAAEAYQRGGILMAKNGLVAMCYDPIGQGERLQLLDKTPTKEGFLKPAIPGSTSEHTMVGVGALLIGRSTASYRIWDGIRALDYLESRPEVDPKKLGCTGNSGGGTMTAYLMALDDRIYCAAPSCYITSLERLFATIGPQDAEQNITGQVAFGMEHADYLTMRAPRPTLMAVATQDFFDIKGSWTSYHEASAIYKKLGAEEKMAIFEYDDKHGWSKPRREACMRWMRKWLLGKDDNPVETDFPHYKDADLQCTRSGQVLEDFRGVSVFDLNRIRAEELARERARFVTLDREKQTHIISELLAWDVPYEAKRDRAIVLYRSWYSGDKRKPWNKVVYMDDQGFETELANEKRRDRLLEKFEWVVGLDPRGIGRSAPGKLKIGKLSFFGVDFKEVYLSIHLNRPLLGQRTEDLTFYLPRPRNEDMKEEGPDETHIIAKGHVSCLVALHCAATNPKVTSITLENPLLSWSNVVATPVSYNQLTNVVPGVLQHYDLPELATMIAPRPLTIRNAVDAQGRPVSLKLLEETYRVTREHYDRMKVGKNLMLETTK